MKVLILASNRTLTLSLLRCLSGAGIRAHVLANGNYPVVRASRWCSGFDRFDPQLVHIGSPTLARMTGELAIKNGCEVILPSGIEAVKYLSAHARAIEQVPIIPLAEPHVITMLDDKWRFQRFACEAGVTTPAGELFTDVKSVSAKSLTFPLVVKPTTLDGSRGVKAVHNQLQLIEHISTISKNGTPAIMLQEYIPGDDISISMLASAGRVVAWAVHTWVGKDHDLQFIYDSDVMRAAARLVAASKFDGLINFDFRRHKKTGELYALECNPRPYASIHIAMCAGINFAKLAIDTALGIPISDIMVPSDRVIHPERALIQLITGKARRSQLSPATLRGLELDQNDALASLVRLVEKYTPGLSRYLDSAPNRPSANTFAVPETAKWR